MEVDAVPIASTSTANKSAEMPETDSAEWQVASRRRDRKRQGKPVLSTVMKKKHGHPRGHAQMIKSKQNADERSITVPTNRKAPLKENWKSIVDILVNQLKLQARVNTRGSWKVELRKSKDTTDDSHLQKGADFVIAFLKGFDLEDAKVLIRMEGLYIETFSVGDIKQTLKGDHMARAVGRICGINGRIKHTIENTTRTRLVVADQTIHLLGSYQNIALARRAISELVMGSPPNKVYGKLRTNAARLAASF